MDVEEYKLWNAHLNAQGEIIRQLIMIRKILAGQATNEPKEETTAEQEG